MGFVPIGIMECWKNGFKGILSAFKIDIFIVLPTIPLFHYSSIALKLHYVPIHPDALCFGKAYKHA